VLAGVVYGLDPIEPATLAIVTLGLSALAALAALLPARKALGIDPMEELRSD
jgi:ABC-type antimicrobial peptide transport system permease subunit